eukprot:m.17318 g.17318  ORF g.17318 m.17318 type:complete len:331 (+) comp5983_c0_seq1:320-1312(+)
MDVLHLIPTTAKPSFFELIAMDALRKGIYPALQYCMLVLTQHYPDIVGSTIKYTDEIYFILHGLLQNHYLRAEGASFAESFYGLKRSLISKDGDSSVGMSRYQRWSSFLFLVVFPYVDEKAQKFRNHLQSQVNRTLHWTEKLFVKALPITRAICAGVNLLYQALYLLELIEPCSPWLHLLGLKIQRVTFADYQASQAAKEATDKLVKTKGIFRRITHAIGKGLAFSVPILLFVLSFMQWWYANDNTGKIKDVIIPPPPKPGTVSKTGVSLPSDNRICPLCRNLRENPTVLAASGFVFCYECIHKHVNDHERCPVTHARASIDMLISIHNS